MTGEVKRKLEGLKPERVFYYFEELCNIPHGSGNTKEISDYCVTFAKEHNLTYRQDEHNNVVIRKNATAGYENHPGVILQGHLDMVCEKTRESAHDFTQEGLKLYCEDGFVKAKDTTLGGDDGIAVAYALAILEDNTLAHPFIEAVFTVDEEIGMLGADAMDMSDLKGHYLMNIDSEEEGIFLTSCAGGVTAKISLPVNVMPVIVDTDGDFGKMKSYTVEISGLTGGHSGTEIHRGRANAHKLLGRLLYAWNQGVRYSIESIEGGTKDNAIACIVSVKVLVVEEDVEEFIAIAKELESDFQVEYAVTDPNLSITIANGATGTTEVHTMMNPKSKEKLTFFLMQMPNGVVRMSAEMENFVESSLNSGILHFSGEEVEMGFLIRSSVESAKWCIYDQLQYLAEYIGADFDSSGDYPGWKYRAESNLRDIMAKVFEEQNGRKPEIMGIHAGLECGIFADRIADVDIVSFGPDIMDIHTYKERLSIDSVERTWKLIVETLRRL